MTFLTIDRVANIISKTRLNSLMILVLFFFSNFMVFEDILYIILIIIAQLLKPLM